MNLTRFLTLLMVSLALAASAQQSPPVGAPPSANQPAASTPSATTGSISILLPTVVVKAPTPEVAHSTIDPNLGVSVYTIDLFVENTSVIRTQLMEYEFLSVS